MIKDYKKWAKKRTNKDTGQYVVMWVSLITNYTGHGQAISKKDAKDFAAFANKSVPNIHHWAVPAE